MTAEFVAVAVCLPCFGPLLRRRQDRPPAVDLALHILLERRWRALGLARDRPAKVRNPLLHARIVERLIQSIRELRDDRRGRAFRCEDAGPDAHIVIDVHLLRGRHIRQRGEAFAGRNRVGLDRTRFHLLDHAHRLFAEEIDVAADKVVHRRPRAAIGDRGGRRADRGIEEKTRHVRRRADAAMRLLEAGAVLLQVGDEFLQIFRREILARDDDRGRMRRGADRHEILGRIVFDVWRQHRCCHMRAHRARKQRVAVGCGRRDPGAADGAARAADVLDHERMPERPAHRLGDDAGYHVARSAGGEGHHHCDVACRIVLRRSRLRAADEQRGETQCLQNYHSRLHRSSRNVVRLCAGAFSVRLQNLRHFHTPSFARRQHARADDRQGRRREFAADLGLAVAAHRARELFQLLDERIVVV